MLHDYLINQDALSYLERYIHTLSDEALAPDDRKYIIDNLKALNSRKIGNKPVELSYEEWWNLLDKIALVTKSQTIGLEIGSHIKASDCGLIGYLFLSSKDVLSAFKSYQRFERLLYSGSHVETKLTDQQITLSWNTENGLSTQHSDSLLLAGLVSVLREIMDDPVFKPTFISFTQAITEEQLAHYTQYFSCPIKYSQQRLEIGFNQSKLNRPLPHWDQSLHDILEKQAQTAVSSMQEEKSWLVDIDKHLIQMFQEGECSAKELSSRLGTSERSFHRKLNQNNLLYRDVLMRLRMRLTKQYLKDERLGLYEIALMLGYSEQSAFNRACKKWFSMTPKQLRDNLLL